MSLFDIENLNNNSKKSDDWKWSFSDYPKEKNGLKVFSCFACGGGSTMGYKLAGCEVLGDLEIDPKMNEIYVKNHNPKYNYLMDIRDFNKLDDLPDELYHLDILDGSPPCFEAGTLVNTTDGYVPIEQITTKHKVFTHKNRYMQVTNTMKKVAKEYLELKLQGCFPIKVTPNHPFYVREMTRKGHKQVKTFSEPMWVSAEELKVVRNKSNTVKSQHYVGFPIIQEQKLPDYDGYTKTYKIFNKTDLTKTYNKLDLSSVDFWYFIGRWFGDGWFRDSRQEVIVCCGKHERDEMHSLLENANLFYSENEERSTYRYTISNVELYHYMQQFGKGALGKRITNDILYLPVEQLKGFIDGYMSADGHYDKDKNICSISSVNKSIIFGLQQCIAKCYHKPTTLTSRKINNCKIENREVNTHISYTITFREQDVRQQHFIYEDGYLWIPFRKSTLISKELPVYNLSVDTDESYTVYNYAVHNCTTFSMAGEREDSWGKKKKFREGQAEQTLDDLSFVFIETVDKLKPKTVIMENVEGLMLGNAYKYVLKIYQKLEEIGYRVKHWLVKGEEMGIPQSRHRVIFLAIRNGIEFDLDSISMSFNYEPVTYGMIKDDMGRMPVPGSKTYKLLCEAKYGEKDLGPAHNRLYGKVAFFQNKLLYDDQVPLTIRAKSSDFFSLETKRGMSAGEIVSAQTFPQDYDFMGGSDDAVGFICGMSVPPVMMKRVVTRLIESGLFDYKNNDKN